MKRLAPILATAAILATSSPAFAAPRAGGVVVFYPPLVRHGEVTNLGPAKYPNGADDARLGAWLAMPEGTSMNSRAQLCRVLPGSLQAGCLDRK
jgi:hypothetical protein